MKTTVELFGLPQIQLYMGDKRDATKDGSLS